MPLSDRDWLCKADVAAHLGVSEKTVDRLIRGGGLHAIRCGRAVRVSRDSVQQLTADPTRRVVIREVRKNDGHKKKYYK
jgi:excisionase family DNA binding protein